MKVSRRQFTVLGGAATFMAGMAPTIANAARGQGRQTFPADAWHQRMKRIVQLNFTERDADGFDLDAWVNYLADTRCECTFLSISSIITFYPTALPEFPRSRWLNGRDIVGECTAAAKARGIRVVGRISIDTARLDLAEQHPEWFRRRKDGGTGFDPSWFAPGDPSSAQGFAPTCQFTSYYSDSVPRLIDEVMRRYKLDGIFVNGWPGTSAPACYCEACRKIGDPASETYRLAYQRRVEQLWQRYTAIVEKHDPRAIFFGNLGSSVRGGDLDLKAIADRAPVSLADNQGRQEAFAPSWDAAQQCRIARAYSDPRPAICSTAAWWSASPGIWRTIAGNSDEVRSRLFQTLAAGGTMHYHWLGFRQGFTQDRRWQQVGRDVMQWQARHDPHFHNVKSLAKVALLCSPATNRLYEAPVGTDGMDSFQGMYKLLNEQRILFDIVVDGQLSAEKLAAYDVLLLPNIALMSDATAVTIRNFAAAGGSILATFETGLRDANGKPRADFALADLFDIRRAGERHGFGSAGHQPGPASMQRIEQRHPIVASFTQTEWIQGSSWRVPITITATPILTDIPQHAIYPVEAVFPASDRSDVPTIAINEQGGSRRVLSEDVEAGYWRTGGRDLGDLLAGALRWLSRDSAPVSVDGGGLLEISAWRTEPGFALHLVNHGNPAFRGSAIRKTYDAGPQKVRMTLPTERPVKELRLLRADMPVTFDQQGRAIAFSIPALEDYEVAAVTL